MSAPIPHGRTARRLEWRFLLPHVRDLIERHCGSPVVDAASAGGGFTPGFASVLTCEDGSRHFVKAASGKAQRLFAESYRREALVRSALPDAVPAPALLWSHDSDWMVLGLEYVEARAPRRPWRSDEVDATLDALETCAELLTPAPETLRDETAVDEFASWPARWERVRATRQDLPHLDEAAALAGSYAAAVVGDTLSHTDVRDDNVLIRPDGVALLCDWNWPVVGADWLDTVFLLMGLRGDGLDVEKLLASRRLTRDVPADHIDALLALAAGYFLSSADEPVPPTSPHLRDHQRWYGEACWGWLAERRGWV
ncbi:phosphotransferase family protein [Nocardioides sp. LHG3406-4]|uniref:phosphotransferase family protein n=1 Tax=Nocardioides sp. LHG3406-4 TaxID=2804575 RepID=UPI003CE7AD35